MTRENASGCRQTGASMRKKIGCEWIVPGDDHLLLVPCQERSQEKSAGLKTRHYVRRPVSNWGPVGATQGHRAGMLVDVAKLNRREISHGAGRPFRRSEKAGGKSACSARNDGGGARNDGGRRVRTWREGAAAMTVQFKTDATVVPMGLPERLGAGGTRAPRRALVQEVPAALAKRLVDQDAGKCLGLPANGRLDEEEDRMRVDCSGR